jgi:hypothetical protein
VKKIFFRGGCFYTDKSIESKVKAIPTAKLKKYLVDENVSAVLNDYDEDITAAVYWRVLIQHTIHIKTHEAQKLADALALIFKDSDHLQDILKRGGLVETATQTRRLLNAKNRA